jgi:hypothetical protein
MFFCETLTCYIIYINMPLGFDLVFSYWLFAWFLIYECGGTTYNPKPWFVIGLLENTLLFGTMLYYRNPTKILILFLLINTCIKLIPLWILRNTSFRSSDVIAGLVLHRWTFKFAHFVCVLIDLSVTLHLNTIRTCADYNVQRCIWHLFRMGALTGRFDTTTGGELL